MNPKPATALLVIALTLVVVLVLWSNMASVRDLAMKNREVAVSNGTVVEALSKTTQALVDQQGKLVELQSSMVELQNRVTGFSDEQIKARRAQGIRAKTLDGLCRSGQLKGKPCENLPDPATLEMLER